MVHCDISLRIVSLGGSCRCGCGVELMKAPGAVWVEGGTLDAVEGDGKGSERTRTSDADAGSFFSVSDAGGLTDFEVLDVTADDDAEF